MFWIIMLVLSTLACRRMERSMDKSNKPFQVPVALVLVAVFLISAINCTMLIFAS